MERTLFTLVRHGETPANTGGVWHGSSDTPLSERGHRQAARLAEHLARAHRDVAALYTSPLERARHTAEPIARALSLEPSLDPGLGEYHLGAWEGLTYEALLKEHELWQNMARDPDWKPHGGESGRDVVERFQRALEGIAERHPGARVVLVSHGGAMSLFMAAALRGRLGEWYEPMHNCAVSELVLVPKAELLRFNDAAHLEGI
jgi:broad specificity phosphatase PhoE